jgi:hypothetical protein
MSFKHSIRHASGATVYRAFSGETVGIRMKKTRCIEKLAPLPGFSPSTKVLYEST